MSFLQPLLLMGLPLVALPILIHLINRQRHRTIPWAAMMFLLDAKRMTRGMARLRHWLIMAMRMLAIAGLIFAIARPLASGWLGLAVGGQADTTIIVLDRSASMEQQDVQTGQTKRSTALAKLSRLLGTFGAATRVVLIENSERRALRIDTAAGLPELPEAGPTATSADLPAMLQAALDYVVANRTGRTDIWICSDLRAHDWNADDGRWAQIRENFERLDGIRFYLLSYRQPAPDNLSVRIHNVRRRQIGQTVELVLDIELQRQGEAQGSLHVPLEIVINGARSVQNIEMTDRQYTLQGHTIPLDAATERGWGRVELPTDANLQDNVGYFVFDRPPVQRTVIVSDDRSANEPLRLAAASPLDPALSYEATVLPPDRADEIDWETTSLLLWQAPLPEGFLARQLENFAASGRVIMFFPPAEPGGRELFAARWGDWRQAPAGKAVAVASWRGDSDLLARTGSGAALPVGKLRTYRYREILGETSELARLDDGSPLLARAATDGGAVYFCATLPHAGYSSLAQDGVVLYVMIQRALTRGAATLGGARQLFAGTPAAREVTRWRSLAEPPDVALASAQAVQAGALESPQGDRLAALNRPPGEDLTATLDDVAVERLFAGLDYRFVEDQLGSAATLASEIWRSFLFAMAIALLVEAWLCLPEPKRVPAAAAVSALET